MLAAPTLENATWVDYIGAFSGLIGALLAAIAIAYAAWTNSETRKDIARERRLEFELRILADLRHQMSVTQLQHISGYISALIRDPADETDLPLLRAAVGTKAGPVGESQRAELASQGRQAELLQVAYREVDEAMQRRLDEGSS